MMLSRPELMILIPFFSAFFTALIALPMIFQGLIIAFIIPLAVRYDRYYSYLYKYSPAIRMLLDINKHYVFSGIRNLSVRHTYDNDYYYQRVNPKDYLIYRIPDLSSEIKLAISNATDNRINYEKYKKEVADNCKYGMIPLNTGRLSREVLLKYEKKEFEHLLYKPVTAFMMNSTIVRTSEDDYYKYSKTETFDSDTIADLMERLKEKSGDFYSDKEIWESVCRVEEAKISNKVKYLIIKKDYDRCCRCGTKRDLTVVHIFPISKGGKTTYSNLQTLCVKCAKRKGNRIIRYQLYE